MVMGQLSSSADVIVIGAGPGGYTAAIRAGQLGKSVILIEKDQIGGLCLNYGCIPSKALIHVANLVEDIQEAKTLGINASVSDIDLKKIQEWKSGVIDRLQKGVEFLCKQANVQIIKGKARFESSKNIAVETEDGLKTFDFKKAIIACGTKPTEIPGFKFDEDFVLSSKEALDLKEIPKKLVIVGGGYIGVELGTVLAKLGSQITIVEHAPTIIPAADKDMSDIVHRKLEKQGVKIIVGARAKSIEGKRIVVSTPAEEIKLDADKVMVSVGIKSDTSELKLENTKVELDEKGFIKVNEKMQTNDNHIYAIGDVVGQPALAHKAYREAKIAAEVICGKKVVFDNKTIPIVIFSDPEIAGAGLNEKEAKDAGHEVVVGKLNYMASGRALTTNKKDGFVKVIADKNTKQVLGIHIVGLNASDMIGEAALAIEMSAFLDDIAYTIHPHPTLCEAIMEAAENALHKIE